MRRAGTTIAFLALVWVGIGTFAPPASATPAAPSPPAVLDTFPPGTQVQLNGLITQARSVYHIPGVIVSVSVPGEGAWTGAYGFADLQSGQRLSLADHFPIGSVTKTFTATLILRLVQQGLLSLSAPISRWVPWVQNARQITVRMLLNMTSGIHDEFETGSRMVAEITAHPHRILTPEEMVRRAVAQGPLFPPGKYEYSSTNYFILGIIAQDITHQTIGNLITSQIIQPLHLDQTSYATSSAMPSPFSLDYLVNRGSPKTRRLYDMANLGPAGGIVSTAHDMAVWARALGTGELLARTLEAKRLQFGQMQADVDPLPTQKGDAPSLPFRYGLGVFTMGGLVGHNGGVKGYVDDVFYSPSRHATIVVFANAEPTAVSSKETAADALTVSIADIVLRHR